MRRKNREKTKISYSTTKINKQIKRQKKKTNQTPTTFFTPLPMQTILHQHQHTNNPSS
jgi:hypothetical protein